MNRYTVVYIFHMSYCLVGEKIWLFVKKKRKFKGDELEKGEKSVKVPLYLGEKISFQKKGGGQKYHILENIHTCRYDINRVASDSDFSGYPVSGLISGSFR